jgi:hypothetical protein
MTRVLLCVALLLLAGCAGHAPLPEPTALEPLAAAPAALAPAGGEEAAGLFAVYAVLGLGVVVLFVVDLLLLPAYFASDEKGLYFPCMRFLF